MGGPRGLGPLIGGVQGGVDPALNRTLVYREPRADIVVGQSVKSQKKSPLIRVFLRFCNSWKECNQRAKKRTAVSRV